jgi:hypothetical protein
MIKHELGEHHAIWDLCLLVFKASVCERLKPLDQRANMLQGCKDGNGRNCVKREEANHQTSDRVCRR